MNDEAATFGERIAGVLADVLAGDFVGASFVGSLAVGGYVPGESDIDIVAVSAARLDEAIKQAVIDGVLAATQTCPARGLELTVYRVDVVGAPPQGADFEVNVNGGPRMPTSIHRTAEDEPGFWYVLDRAIAHRCGVAISGPSPAALFADVPRSVLLDAMHQSMTWHRMHEKATLYSVLNASRAWRFAVDDVLGSKLDGAAWARSRWLNPELIDAAVDLRHGRPAHLDAEEVDRLLRHVEEAIRPSPA